MGKSENRIRRQMQKHILELNDLLQRTIVTTQQELTRLENRIDVIRHSQEHHMEFFHPTAESDRRD